MTIEQKEIPHHLSGLWDVIWSSRYQLTTAQRVKCANHIMFLNEAVKNKLLTQEQSYSFYRAIMNLSLNKVNILDYLLNTFDLVFLYKMAVTQPPIFMYNFKAFKAIFGKYIKSNTEIQRLENLK